MAGVLRGRARARNRTSRGAALMRTDQYHNTYGTLTVRKRRLMSCACKVRSWRVRCCCSASPAARAVRGGVLRASCAT